MKKEHILSSNIVSLSAIVDILTSCPHPVAVLQVSGISYLPKNLIDINWKIFSPSLLLWKMEITELKWMWLGMVVPCGTKL